MRSISLAVLLTALYFSLTMGTSSLASPLPTPELASPLPTPESR